MLRHLQRAVAEGAEVQAGPQQHLGQCEGRGHRGHPAQGPHAYR